MNLSIRIAVILLVLTLFNSCSNSQDSIKRRQFAFIVNGASDFWTLARRGCEKADAELGNVLTDFRIPPEATAAEQKRIIDDMLSKGVDGIAISPVDPKNQVGMLNEVAKQTLVVTQDSDAPESDRAVYVGTDNIAAGRQAGALIKEALPHGGKIMVFVGKLDAQNAQERLQGIKETIEGSNINIVDVRTDDIDRVRAKSNVADALVKYPDLAALVGLWSYNGPAILNAVRDAGKIGKVKIIAFDEEEETLVGVGDGSIYGTVVQQPYEFGYRAIQLMAQIVGGDRSAIPSNKQIIVPTLIIKRDNVTEFKKRVDELRKGSI
jgi:ribose transport system substrate-binding protein